MVHEVMELPIKTTKIMGGGTMVMYCLLDNTNLADGFFAREIGIFATDPDTQEEKKQEMLSRIMGKLKSGKKLSAKELDFLRRTDPILYAHALRVQRMAEALKQQLSHAKSKQEANDMITSAIAGVSDKDPDKEYLLAAYNEVSKNFHKSPAYQRLPNTPEDAKKRKTNNPNAHFTDDEDTNDDTDDLLSWTPLQEIIDAAPTLECQG